MPIGLKLGRLSQFNSRPNSWVFVTISTASVLDAATLHLAWRLRRRYRLALLSNATQLLVPRLVRNDKLLGLFDTIIISALEGARKPEPAIFNILCRRLGLPPAACVLIDDRARNTTAAVDAGLRAVEHVSATATDRALRVLGLRF